MSGYPPLPNQGYGGPSAPPPMGFAMPGYPDPNQGGGAGYPPYPPGPMGGQHTPQMPGYPQPPPSYSAPGEQPNFIPMQPMQGYAPTMQSVQLDPNVPPGLEYLNTIDHMFVQQKVELLEAMIGFETNNKYTIKNNRGDKMFYAVEENDMCSRNIFGKLRQFDMRIMDLNKTEIMRIRRPMRCMSCCFPCCLQECEIFTTQGQPLGSITQDWTLWKPRFTVRDSTGEPVLSIDGPFCPFGFCGTAKFRVMSLDGDTKVGKITKEWSGIAREWFTDSDYFGVSFPQDLDVKIKAVLLAATFLIDFMYFEKDD